MEGNMMDTIKRLQLLIRKAKSGLFLEKRVALVIHEGIIYVPPLCDLFLTTSRVVAFS
jgi:hypothetical protein